MGLAIATSSWGPVPPVAGEDIAGCAPAWNSHRVLFENDRVGVLDVLIEPGTL